MTLTGNSTSDRLRQQAMLLVQQRGYHGFSYRDLAERIGIRTASIHYHYPTKADLIEAVIKEQQQGFSQSLSVITSAGQSAHDRLQRFVNIFSDTFGEGDRLCLFCMLASGQDSVPDRIRADVADFWEQAADWVCKVIRKGQSEQQCHADIDPMIAARTLIATLEGAMLTARASRSPEHLHNAAAYLIDTIIVSEGEIDAH